jgi:hypothetical protein
MIGAKELVGQKRLAAQKGVVNSCIQKKVSAGEALKTLYTTG